MKMDVQIKTTVEHPEQNGAVHQHDNITAVSFGCDDPWFVEGEDGTKTPDYLDPGGDRRPRPSKEPNATKRMGVHLDVDGHDCFAELVFEADTIEPGTTPLKWKLNIAEAAVDPCED